MDTVDASLVELGRLLLDAGYRFTAVTPATHRRVNARPQNAEARDARGVFGWSRPFRPDVLPARWVELLDEAGLLTREGGLLRSQIRFASVGSQLFVHSAFPASGRGEVDFGPDTYRFISFLDREVTEVGRAVDVGCGTGAAGLLLAARAERVVLADLNPLALRFARVNAALDETRGVEFLEGDALEAVHGAFDCVVANPPYLVDGVGHGTSGIEQSVRIVRDAMERLAMGGRLFLYTATPVVDGRGSAVRGAPAAARARGGGPLPGAGS